MPVHLTAIPTPAGLQGPNTMKVLFRGNIMDLGLSAGEAAVALRDDFRAETLGTDLADKFLQSVQRASRYHQPDSYSQHHGYLTDAEALLELLSLESGAAISDSARASVNMFRRRVEDGRKLSAKVPPFYRAAEQAAVPEERA
jgi:hypothetical protein